jgi:alkylation response protein AidB-like acyl-CoA dehydrogenase
MTIDGTMETVGERPSFGEMLANERGRALIGRVAALARERLAPRAAHYDRTATFPHEDFEDFFAAGLHAPTVPAEYGGLGLGPYRGDVFTLWMMTKEIAAADLALARCWEGHANSLVLLDGLGTEEQKRRWFHGVVEAGEKWVVWSGEPQAKATDEKLRFGTTLEAVDGGFVLSGTKAFCTSAGGARWALLLVNPAGPGGARHASAATAETVLLLACDLEDPSVRFDGSWWDPIGMRATVSHAVHFDRTFIPMENLVGEPGQYLRDGWQTCFVPQYAAAFLGAAEAAYTYGVDFLRQQNKTDDPYVLHHVAKMAVNVETMHLWLRHIATLWESGSYAEAQAAGSRIRHLAEHLATETVGHCVRACGARVLNRPSPIERILRNLAIYVRHDNDDQVLATIGRQVLGKSFDSSFFKP